MSASSVGAARSAMAQLWAQQDEYNCRYPELQMRVWASPQGMQVAAVLWLPGPKYGRRSLVLSQATWQPSEVTERSVVDWGRRALVSWLEAQIEDLEL